MLLLGGNGGRCFAQSGSADTTSYDFVQGATIIFRDRFNKDAIGTFPSYWKTRDKKPASYVIRRFGDDNALVFWGANNVAYPVILSPLTDTFTVEYDFRGGQDGAITTLFSETMIFGMKPNGNIAEINSKTAVWHGGQYPGVINDTGWHHFAISYKNREIKCYVDQFRLLTIPDCNCGPDHLEFSGYDGMAIKSIVVAKGIGSAIFKKILTGEALISHAVHFDVNSSVIKKESMGFIAQLAFWLKANAGVNLEIDGHTDNDGSAEANMKLSQSRAEEVKKQLTGLGVNKNRLTAKGYGASKPLQANDTPEGRADNRRVEFVKRQ